MKKTQINIINRLGLHARAAAKLVQLASAFTCHIELGHNTKTINGKSIMGVMMLAASKGTQLVLITDGVDEDAAADAICKLIADRFEEDE
ncbi:MAG: HPr family phosphocarrier protein [Gammaproteobacteria bacterium]|nr:HPr family phosphocarrier protein [Gammaproteobacteria bacterium]